MISGPKIVSSSQTPNPIRAAVAARRISTDRSSPKASHRADVEEGHQHPGHEPEHLAGVRHDAEANDAEAGDERDDRGQDEPDDRQPGGELAVDDVVAVDRLGQQARQRPLGALAVDRVEGEGETQQRRHDPDEGEDALALDVRSTANVNRARKTAGGAARLRCQRPDLVRREVERDRGRKPEHDQQDDEPDAQQVIAELLGRDHPPAGLRAADSRRSLRPSSRSAVGPAAAVSAALTRPSS